jgi:CRP-like cAMP-binding protein
VPRGREPRNGSEAKEKSTTAEEKIARLLALIVTKDLPAHDQVGQLNAVGFSNVEIASLLCMSTNHVGVALHKFRRQPKRRSKPEE